VTLEIREIAVFYGKVQALREVSLDVGDGEIVTIIGANGAGKSTLLSAIVGERPVAGGTIRFDGVEITNMPVHQVVRLGITLVPEGRQLFGAMSVEENLALGSYVGCAQDWRKALGPAGRFTESETFRDRLGLVFDMFPVLKERQEQKAGSLSGGEQQMLAVGRALMSSPRFLLLDEPSVGLAPSLVREILGLLARLREQGITILLVEQDAAAALKTAGRGYVMEMGRIVAEGSSKELLNSDRVQRAYLGAR
jgi:branched-chain amino acid transport system ATP-binding protein